MKQYYDFKIEKIEDLSQEEIDLRKKNLELFHQKGWNKHTHYSNIGGQCGQSCSCCRAAIYLNNIDKDAHFGACPICLINNNRYKSFKNT